MSYHSEYIYIYIYGSGFSDDDRLTVRKLLLLFTATAELYTVRMKDKGPVTSIPDV